MQVVLAIVDRLLGCTQILLNELAGNFARQQKIVRPVIEHLILGFQLRVASYFKSTSSHDQLPRFLKLFKILVSKEDRNTIAGCFQDVMEPLAKRPAYIGKFSVPVQSRQRADVVDQ